MKSIKVIIQIAKDLQKGIIFKSRDSEDQKLEFINMIEFDEEINQCFSQIQNFLQEKKQTLLSISSDYIDIKKMNQDLVKIYKLRNGIDSKIKNLIKKQIRSQKLEFLIEIYESFLLSKDNLSKIYNRMIQNKVQIHNKAKQCHFADDKYAYVFISLSDNLGKIVKVSNNFEKIVKILNNKQAIDQNINFMQPGVVAKHHDQILKSYLTKKNKINYASHFNPIIGVDKDNWAIAYNISLQTCQLETFDFGICAEISLVNDKSLYILVDRKQDFQIQTVSYEFYQQILGESIPQQKISKISLNTFIPCFPTILKIYLKNIEKQEDIKTTDREFTTILFKPKDYEQFIKLQDMVSDCQNFFQLLDYQIFAVKGEFQHIQNTEIDIAQIQIREMVQIFDNNLKIEQLNDLKDWIDLNKQESQKLFSSQKKIVNQLLSELQDNNNNQNCFEYSQSMQEGPKEVKKIEFQNSFETTTLLSPYFRQKISLTEEKILSETFLHENARFLQNNNVFTPKNANLSQNSIKLYNPNINEKDNYSFRSNQEIYFSSRINELQQQQKKSEAKYSHLQRAAFFSEYNTIDSFRNKQSSLNYFIENNKAKTNNLQKSQQNNGNAKKESQLFSSNQQDQEDPLEVSIHSSKNSSILRQILLFLEHLQYKKNFFNRKSIIKQMNQTQKFRGIYFVRLFGVFGLLTFLAVSFVIFSSLHKQLQIQKEDLQNVNWGSQIKNPMGEALSDRYYQLLMNMPMFNYYGQQQQDMIKQRIKKISLKNYNTIKILLNKFISSDKSKTDLYNLVLNKQFDSKMQNILSPPQIFHLSFGYSLFINYAHLYYVSHDLDSPDRENAGQVALNYIPINIQLSSISKDVSEKVNDTLDSNMQTMLIFLMVILVTTFLFALTLPIINYYFLQKIQTILKLFATFTPKNLVFMISEIVNCLNLIESNVQKQSDQKFSSKNKIATQQNLLSLIETQIQKKKNISVTNSINQFSFKIIIVSLAFFCLSQVASVTNYFLLQNFIEKQKVNRNFLNNLATLGDYIVSIQVIRVPMIVLNIQGAFSKEFTDLAEEYASQKQTQITILNDLVSQLYNMDVQSSFKDYANKMFENNSCEAISENLNLLSDNLFSMNECNLVANGIFTKGLIQTAQYLINLYDQRISVFQQNDLQKFLQIVLIQEKEFNEYENFYVRIYFEYMIEILVTKMTEISNDHYEQMLNMNYLYLFLAIFTFILSIYITFFYFIGSLISQIKHTKQLLDLIDIQIIEENQYILSYLKIQK